MALGALFAYTFVQKGISWRLEIELEHLAFLDIATVAFYFWLLALILDRRMGWVAIVSSWGLIAAIITPIYAILISVITQVLCVFLIGWIYFLHGMSGDREG